jgi:hypothetical protein
MRRAILIVLARGRRARDSIEHEAQFLKRLVRLAR